MRTATRAAAAGLAWKPRERTSARTRSGRISSRRYGPESDLAAGPSRAIGVKEPLRVTAHSVADMKGLSRRTLLGGDSTRCRPSPLDGPSTGRGMLACPLSLVSLARERVGVTVPEQVQPGAPSASAGPV